MKKVIAIIVGILILVLIIFFVIGKKSSTPVQTSGVQTSTLTSVTVSVLNNDVQIQSSSKISPISKNGIAKEGDTVQTLATGRALIATETGTETLLDYNSQLTITRHDQDGVHDSGFLSLGSTWSRVKKVFGQGEFYEIETHNAVAVVRGTSFGVSYTNGQTTLEVSTGTVRFMFVNPVTRKRDENKTALVTSGQKATVGDDGVIHILPMSSQDKKDPWYAYNNISNNPASTRTQGTATPPVISTPLPPRTPLATPPPPQPTLSLTSATPASATVGDRVYLKGSGFLKLTTVVIGTNTLSQANITITSDTALNFSTANLGAGTYDISVVDISGKTSTLTGALTLQPAPIIPTRSTTNGNNFLP